jgi:hypothetical protein
MPVQGGMLDGGLMLISCRREEKRAIPRVGRVMWLSCDCFPLIAAYNAKWQLEERSIDCSCAKASSCLFYVIYVGGIYVSLLLRRVW